MALSPGVDDLTALALLVSVAELGSLSQAGARHGITQPAASMRVARLEQRMGLGLLDRSTTGCTPTPAGAAIVAWSRELLDAAERMGRAVEALRDVDHGGASIGASLTIAEQLLPRWLAVLHVDQPAERYRVEVANSAAVIELVRNGTISLGLIETSDPTPGLRRRVVGHDRLVVAVAPTHPWARRRTPLQAHQLASTPMVLREIGSGTRATLASALAHAEHRLVAPVLELASTAAVRNAVAAGVAPTVISDLAVADDVTAGRLVVVELADIDLRRELVAVWRGAPPAVLKLIERAAAPA